MRKKKVAFTDEQLSLFRETCWRANRIKNEAVRFHTVCKEAGECNGRIH